MVSVFRVCLSCRRGSKNSEADQTEEDPVKVNDLVKDEGEEKPGKNACDESSDQNHVPDEKQEEVGAENQVTNSTGKDETESSDTKEEKSSENQDEENDKLEENNNKSDGESYEKDETLPPPPILEPEPDYNDDEDDLPSPPPSGDPANFADADLVGVNLMTGSVMHGEGAGSDSENRRPFMPATDESGLIGGHKLVNPCVESTEKQNLHREMLLNQRMGIDVLRRKSELRKELDKRTDRQKQKEQRDSLIAKRTPFEIKMEEQANKLKQHEVQGSVGTSENSGLNPPTPEFLKVRLKIRSQNGSPLPD